MQTPLSTPILSSPLSGIGNVGRFDPTGNFTPSTSANVNPNGGFGFGTGEPPSFNRQQSSRRESFGSVFPGSSGTGGNGNGDGDLIGMREPSPRTRTMPPMWYAARQ